MGKSSANTALQQWCEDHLHHLLGFADSALASYLVHIAKKAKSPGDIESVLNEGNVKARSAEAQHSFCQSLYQKSRCCSNSRRDINITSSKGRTNADWINMAKNYSMLDDEDEQQKTDQINRKEKESPFSSTDETKSRKKIDSISRSRRHRSAQEDDDGDDDKRERSSSKRDRLKEKKKRLRTSGRKDGDDDEESSSSRDDVKKESVEEKRERRHERKRRRNIGKDHQFDEHQETMNMDALTPEERAELQRQKDMRERDEFVQRMLERDKRKTKSVGRENENDNDIEESSETVHKRIDMEERLARGETIKDEDGREFNLERLRTESRRAYLKKRQEREVTLLKQSLEDEEDLFRNQKLSAAERKRIELGRKIIKMVEKNENKQDVDDGFYRLPDEYDEKETKSSQNQALLKSRYVESKHEKSEQELWEESQTRKAEIVHKKKKNTGENEYGFIFDEQIDFVMQETTKGYDKRDKKHHANIKKEKKEEEDDVSVIKPITEHDKILAGRKKLPVFPYREEFLAALKEHQVLILVGETGSGKTTQVRNLLHRVTIHSLVCLFCCGPLTGPYANLTGLIQSLISLDTPISLRNWLR
jgi:pre-mRNA-splicing factor ATP-dependent RNA helicase DHX16